MSSSTQEAPAAAGAEPLPAAKAPLGFGTVSLLGALLALGLLALAVIAVRDTLIQMGVVHGTRTLRWLAQQLDGTRPALWMLVGGIIAIVVGLFLVGAALKPRPSKALRLRATTGVFLQPGGVARIASRAAQDVDGVLSAKASASRRKVEVRARVTSDPAIDERITAAVTRRLSALDPAPTVRVKTDVDGGAS